MTFDTILALDNEALNLMIEQHCYPAHAWRQVSVPNTGGHLLWELCAPDTAHRTWSSVPHLHHTASWNSVMALAWRYRIGVWPLHEDSGWLIQHPAYSRGLSAQTEDEARLAVCQLVLWQTLQRQGRDADAARADEAAAAEENRLAHGGRP